MAQRDPENEQPDREETTADGPTDRPRVGLFVTCLIDLFRPNIGFAAVQLLERAGCEVEVPDVQTCCGQPAYNSGDNRNASAIAQGVIQAFEGYDYVVGASGSCMGMLREHYPRLFVTSARWRVRAERLSTRCHELLSFLTDVRGMRSVDASYPGRVTYHDSCSGLRELNIHRQPRALLRTVRGLELRELTDSNVCCGFGGTFCVKYPEISARMVEQKTGHVEGSGANTLLGGDLGCLLNIAGKLKRDGSDVKVYHVAEVLAGMTDEPAIGEG